MTMFCVVSPKLGGLCVVKVPALLRMHVEHSLQTNMNGIMSVCDERKNNNEIPQEGLEEDRLGPTPFPITGAPGLCSASLDHSHNF